MKLFLRFYLNFLVITIIIIYKKIVGIESEDIWWRRIERDREVRKKHEKGKGQRRE